MKQKEGTSQPTDPITNLEEILGEQEGDADGGDADEGDDNDFQFKAWGSTCNMKIDDSDLSGIVNGFPDDPILFDSTFTRQNVWKRWCKVVFIPMN